LIEKSAQVARDATQDLLRMVRHTNHERTRTDLSAVIRDVVRLLRPEAQTKRVNVRAEVEDSCWVEGKRSQLFSIVWNLAHNAVQMVPAGGEVSIHTRVRGTLIDLEVRDNGPGMSEAQQEHAFHWFGLGDRSRHGGVSGRQNPPPHVTGQRRGVSHSTARGGGEA
jgi:signal transduction histidine kinase